VCVFLRSKRRREEIYCTKSRDTIHEGCVCIYVLIDVTLYGRRMLYGEWLFHARENLLYDVVFSVFSTSQVSSMDS
jgi:hypothetical protein